MSIRTQSDTQWEEGFAAGRHDVLRVYPTRDQLAEGLYEQQFRGGYHAEWDRLVGDARDFWLAQADAALTLFPSE